MATRTGIKKPTSNMQTAKQVLASDIREFIQHEIKGVLLDNDKRRVPMHCGISPELPATESIMCAPQPEQVVTNKLEEVFRCVSSLCDRISSLHDKMTPYLMAKAKDQIGITAPPRLVDSCPILSKLESLIDFVVEQEQRIIDIRDRLQN